MTDNIEPKSFATEHVAKSRASKEQLLTFAGLVLQIEVDESMTKEKVLALIEQAGWQRDTIPTLTRPSSLPMMSDATGSARPHPFPHNFQNKGAMRQCIKIRINTEEKAGGDRKVFVAVNGSGMEIPRGRVEAIPVEYVEALENAEELIYEPSVEGLPEPRIVKSYPFSYVA